MFHIENSFKISLPERINFEQFDDFEVRHTVFVKIIAEIDSYEDSEIYLMESSVLQRIQ